MDDNTDIPGEGKSRSWMAGGMAMHRAAESMLPEDERICYDPYAVRFIDPGILKYAAEHPEEAARKLEEMERLFPGLKNSIRVRVRFFDEMTRECVRDGCTQVVIFGAGYDTRAYRVCRNDGLRVFEVDHPATQEFKKLKIQEIFGVLPGYVTYIPLDLETWADGKELLAGGYASGEKTLFLLEGVTMYLRPGTARSLFRFMLSRSGHGSRILFDYYPESVINGTSGDESAKNIMLYTRMNGEPLQFGIPDGRERELLGEWGGSDIRIITADDYRRRYCTGKNAGRRVCPLLSFMEVRVP